MESEYLRMCARCVMDESASGIRFDGQGVCNFCTDFLAKEQLRLSKAKQSVASVASFLAEVKGAGHGKEFDCVIGVSGGVDSCYALLLAVRSGLRVLAVHFDNGWNSELAANNIEKLTKSLGVRLETHVVNWNEFRDLQLSMMKAHVVDIEILTDNAMTAVNYQLAHRHGVKYILAGTNQATEGMQMPLNWNHFKLDSRNIRAIHRRFGTTPLKTMPLISPWSFLWYKKILKINWVSFLDFFPYNREKAIQELVEVGFRPYPYKHYESVFTRFYQAYLLPKKFHFDKRRLHFSNLICSNQMTRNDAIMKLAECPIASEELLTKELPFFLKKLGLSREKFEEYLSEPRVDHLTFPSWLPIWEKLLRFSADMKSATASKETL